jgi:hypothetical protein
MSLLFFRLNAVELAQFTLRIQLAHVVGGEAAPFTNPFLLGLVPLDIMLAHAFLRVLALPKTSSASLSQCATAGWSAYSPESCRNWTISVEGGLEGESGAALPFDFR